MAGSAFGIAIWVGMTFAGLPLLNPIMRERVVMMRVAWFIAHLGFGMGLGAAPACAAARPPELVGSVPCRKRAPWPGRDCSCP